MNTTDQYLKAIYLVARLEGGRATNGSLAERLDVSPATVSGMIDKLEAEGLVDHVKYEGTALTEAGVERARDALETYCILEWFLVHVLEVEAYREEATQLEPVIDATVAERLDLIVDRRPECPDCFDAERDACPFLDASDVR